jgi:hypothetical protein
MTQEIMIDWNPNGLFFGFENGHMYSLGDDAELDIPENLRVAFATKYAPWAVSAKWNMSRSEYQTPEILKELRDWDKELRDWDKENNGKGGIVYYGVDRNGNYSTFAKPDDLGSVPFGFEGEPIYDYWKDAELDIPEDLRVAFATQQSAFARVKWDMSRPEYQTPEILEALADLYARWASANDKGNAVKD